MLYSIDHSRIPVDITCLGDAMNIGEDESALLTSRSRRDGCHNPVTIENRKRSTTVSFTIAFFLATMNIFRNREYHPIFLHLTSIKLILVQ